MNPQQVKLKYDSLSARAVAGYAAYQSAIKTAKMVADKICHTWQVDQDYTWDLHAEAVKLVVACRVKNPFLREKKYERPGEDFGDTPRLSIPKWASLNIPEIGRLVQVRTMGYSELEFRSPRTKDLTDLRELLSSRIKEVEPEKPRKINFDDYPSTTQIMSWNSKDGSWEYRKERRSRSFKTVFLPIELQQEIEHDLRTFTESHKRLHRLELAWRRGYLLSGPPGTGKTSLSLAIAGTLGFQLASLSLTDIKSDGELRKAVSQLRNKTVLVIEDIDAYSVSHERDHNTAKDGDLSLSGLLNSLDGFETPEGLVTIATTNHVENLDAALIRSGRLDRIFTLDHIEAAELERLFMWFYEEEPPSEAPGRTREALMAPAEVTEIFKQHLNDPVAGWAAINDRIDRAVSVESLTAAA